MRPVAPRPQRDAVKRSARSLREQRTTAPSASRSVRARTCVEMTRKRMPVPCVAVVTTPARDWSEMEPRQGKVRGWGRVERKVWMEEMVEPDWRVRWGEVGGECCRGGEGWGPVRGEAKPPARGELDLSIRMIL